MHACVNPTDESMYARVGQAVFSLLSVVQSGSNSHAGKLVKPGAFYLDEQ